MNDHNGSESFLNRISPGVAAWSVAAVIAVLGLFTAGRTFGVIDSGEMSAAAITLGIPHPTGYPLLMMLGRVAALLLPGPDAFVLNIFAALMVAAGAGILVLVYYRLLRQLSTDASDSGGGVVLYAAGAALLTALTTIWWGQGTIFEAYALHALMMPLVLLTFLRYVEVEEYLKDSATGRFHLSKAGLLFSFVLGLSFSNHMTTVLMAPALITWFFMRLGFSLKSLWRLVALLPGFALGLLPYLYLPIRSAANPALNWGLPNSAQRFWSHVTGEQFRNLMYDYSIAGKQLSWYFSSLPAEFAYLGILLALAGLGILIRSYRRFAVLSGLLFLFCLYYAGTYAIKDIEPYFLTATVAVGFWVAVGLWWLGGRFGKIIPTGITGLAVLLSMFLHWGTVDRSDNRLAEDLARNMLQTLPEDAVLFTTRWDLLYSGISYLQIVENLRPDVTLVNLSMLNDRVYLSQILDRNPEFKAGENANTRIRAFLRELNLYEQQKDEEQFVLVRRMLGQAESESELASVEYTIKFHRMVNGMIAACRRPVFVTSEVSNQVGYGWQRHPYHLALRVTPDSTYLPQESFPYAFSLPDHRIDVDVVSVCRFYATALLARGMYERAHGKEEGWAQCMRQAQEFDPGINPDDVPVMPLGNQTFVRKNARFFRTLKGE